MIDSCYFLPYLQILSKTYFSKIFIFEPFWKVLYNFTHYVPKLFWSKQNRRKTKQTNEHQLLVLQMCVRVLLPYSFHPTFLHTPYKIPRKSTIFLNLKCQVDVKSYKILPQGQKHNQRKEKKIVTI